MTFQSATPLVAGLAFVVYRAIRKWPTSGEKVGALLSLAAGILPAIWVMAARNVSSKLVVGYAVLFFAGSVLLKWAVYRNILSPHIHPRLGPVAGGVVQGALSSACELGVAAIALGLLIPGLSVWDVFGFGAGAAAVEAVMVSLLPNPHAGGPEGQFVDRQVASMRSGPQWLPALTAFAERSIATMDHIACRGLVAFGLATEQAWPLLIAFVAFAFTDGFVHYCLKQRWEFARSAVALTMYGVLAIPAAVSALAWAVAL